ncbi:MAG: hypothetical protein H0V94_03820 [Actinobacteria bacterium]|nr:hypothetical protein [Actinomycetota bacterium]
MLKISRTYLVALLALAALAFSGTALAAHNGNNKAELTGAGGVSGTAIVNYSEGQGTFNGTITVNGLAPNTSYSFFVNGAASSPGRLICSGTSDSSGTFTCNAQKLTLLGFASAELRTSGGAVVASGVFERRGNCRDPEQAGSQCQAK